jgi:hypothetical protein
MVRESEPLGVYGGRLAVIRVLSGDPPNPPATSAPAKALNVAAVPLAVDAAFALNVIVVPLILETVVPGTTLADTTTMPRKSPVADATVAVGLPLVVLIVVDAVKRPAAVACIVSAPAGTRPRRSGTLNVVTPSPFPHGNTVAVVVPVDVALLLTTIVLLLVIDAIVVPVGRHVASIGAPTRI